MIQKMSMLTKIVVIVLLLWLCWLGSIIFELVDYSEINLLYVFFGVIGIYFFLAVSALVKFRSTGLLCKILIVVPLCITCWALVEGYQPPIFNPTIVAEGAEENIFVPATLEEAYDELDKGLSGKAKKVLKSDFDELSEQQKLFLDMVHFEFGMWLRNNWGLWENAELAKEFHKVGVSNPDEMYSIIIGSYIDRLKGERFSIKEAVELYAPTTNSIDRPE